MITPLATAPKAKKGQEGKQIDTALDRGHAMNGLEVDRQIEDNLVVCRISEECKQRV
jgi:hypothetical protein